MTKRPHMPVSVQRDAALYALGLDPENVEWHHQPALSIRPYDPQTGRWTPDANNAKYIIPMAAEAHRERTPGDISTAAKVKRVEKRHAEFCGRLLAKSSGDDIRDVRRRRIPSRPFPKVKRAMRRKG